MVADTRSSFIFPSKPASSQTASSAAPAMSSTKSNKQSNTMTPALLLKLTNTSPRFVPAMPNTGRHM
ncbi:hypothetical protein BASA61_009543 [Batrachochytrium salamandrivorans]|nr:hypothetical protein BASA61_009543 [Batrachochytrium salamandrivorans]KAJ1328505.1 hypothetical protein BSLG_010237 [Batrachochytrium salamandrivorans]